MLTTKSSPRNPKSGKSSEAVFIPKKLVLSRESQELPLALYNGEWRSENINWLTPPLNPSELLSRSGPSTKTGDYRCLKPK
jgi:hypothetical protein